MNVLLTVSYNYPINHVRVVARLGQVVGQLDPVVRPLEHVGRGARRVGPLRRLDHGLAQQCRLAGEREPDVLGETYHRSGGDPQVVGRRIPVLFVSPALFV